MELLRITECKPRMGYRSNASIYQDVRAGLFTKPVKISERSSAWPDYEVDAIVRARIAGQSKAEIRALVQRLEKERTANYAAA